MWVAGGGVGGVGDVGDMVSHTLVWPLELEIWTPTLQCGPLSWGYGLHGGPLPARTGLKGRAGTAPPLRAPNWSYGTMGFVGAKGAGDFA